jgi:type IV secretion system protein VirB6
VLGTGAGPPASVVGAPQGLALQQVASSFDPLALGAARALYLTGATGALAAMRLIAGIMLALGPFFIAFLLFESTRGLFEGWIRVLAGAALGALGTAVVLGVELALIEARLAELIAWRTAGYSIPGAAAELFVLSLVFALVVLAILIASWRLTVGFGLPAAWRSAPAQLAAAIAGTEARTAAHAGGAVAPASIERSRAVAVAEAVAVVQRREALQTGTGHDPATRRAEPHAGSRDTMPDGAPPPLGQGHRRRTRGRLSSSAGRRDKSA